MSSLVFVPTECEVVNMANTDQTYSLWDAANPDMCDLSSSPVNFKIVQEPTDDHINEAPIEMENFFVSLSPLGLVSPLGIQKLDEFVTLIYEFSLNSIL